MDANTDKYSNADEYANAYSYIGHFARQSVAIPSLHQKIWLNQTDANTYPDGNADVCFSRRVILLDNHSSFVDSIDYLNIVGEVQNSTRNYLTFVRIAASFFNSSGQLLDTDFTYIYLDNLPPGEKTCFNIFLEHIAGWS